jgi:hypothetical protein
LGIAFVQQPYIGKMEDEIRLLNPQTKSAENESDMPGKKKELLG